jgi:hypothetical protein
VTETGRPSPERSQPQGVDWDRCQHAALTMDRLHISNRYNPLALLKDGLWWEINRVVKADSKCLSLENKKDRVAINKMGTTRERVGQCNGHIVVTGALFWTCYLEAFY